MPELIAFDCIIAGYGRAEVLNNVSFCLEEGQNLAVLGRNGTGKTTLLETLMGNTQIRNGNIYWQGKRITGIASHERARAGIGWVPQGREVFPSLTIEENLCVTARAGDWCLRRIYDLFPQLYDRRMRYGDQLSGGEQQMLAIGRALMTNPRLLLLDEPMEGLAPLMIEQVATSIGFLSRDTGLSCIVVEQHPMFALSITDNAIVLDRGSIIHNSSSNELANDAALLERLLYVTRAPSRVETENASGADKARNCTIL